MRAGPWPLRAIAQRSAARPVAIPAHFGYRLATPRPQHTRTSSRSWLTSSRGKQPFNAAGFSSRRFYSDARAEKEAPKKEAPKAKRKRGAFRSFLVWTWRLTYLSSAAAFVYVGYGVYQLRNPADQLEPDASKKSLVVLGKCVGSDACVRRLTFMQEPDGARCRCSRVSTRTSTM
jgi:hypothetical protein